MSLTRILSFARCAVRSAPLAVRPRAAAPIRFSTVAAPIKYTTHIAGLDVVPNGREVFIGLQKEILASIAQYNKELGVSTEREREPRREVLYPATNIIFCIVRHVC